MVTFKYNQERLFRDDPDLHLLYWGKEDCAPRHSAGPGVRDVYKIHFIHKGKGTLQVGDQTYSLSSGQAFLIYPQIITFYEADRLDPWTYSWVAFHGAQVESILSRTRLSPEQPIIPMDWKVMPGLSDQLTEASSQEVTRDLAIKALMYEFLSVLVSVVPAYHTAQTNPKKQDEYVLQSIEFLHAHYNENITVSQLASFLGLDRKYISVLFKESVGIPPQQYLLRYRIDKAAELLERSSYSIGEVASSVGYKDSLLFSKMFKKMKGVSPKHYRLLLID
ncbi:AraC family transcriptional regulator [Paenibacillus sp. WQ 127069]|uniref:AraC family transcriptional regulator n=1 Tax=Paenibacillus baimaensis TaxID=2982185 RepID=A0ABT2UHJ6_9BACL|nr:AraC family transcriptional regulator [Paenibacillus sp. WQ 127069]MCU6794080.1 AraC family transcriptional regulator [Paenibacillus sp. WQ 127069]